LPTLNGGVFSQDSAFPVVSGLIRDFKKAFDRKDPNRRFPAGRAPRTTYDKRAFR